MEERRRRNGHSPVSALPSDNRLAGKAKKRIETILVKMAVESNAFLLAVGRVLGGIQVDNQPLFVLPL